MVRFFKAPEASWSHEFAISVKPLKVKNWILPEMPGLITDFLISLDDRYLYMNPGLTGQVWVGGLIQKGSSVLAEADDGTTYQVDVPEIKVWKKVERTTDDPVELRWEAALCYQLTNSLFTQWDHQFSPDVVKKGSHMLQIDVNTEKGSLAINQNFFADFGSEPDGPSLAHEMRYPGRDCTSDLWI
ncbi:unnamed protein product [Camellia sinensis]